MNVMTTVRQRKFLKYFLNLQNKISIYWTSVIVNTLLRKDTRAVTKVSIKTAKQNFLPKKKKNGVLYKLY